MAVCEHIAWLRLSGHNDLFLHDGQRFQCLLQEINSPDTQFPSLVLFLGKRQMATALREVFTQNNFRKTRKESFLDLRVDTTTTTSDYPLFFADGDLDYAIPPRVEDPPCHETRVLPLEWSTPFGIHPLFLLYSRLVFPFTDVICLFAEDYGGLERLATILKLCASFGNASSMATSVRPRVIIAVSGHDSSPTYDLFETEQFRSRLQEQNADVQSNSFFHVKLVKLAGDHLSPLARYRRLKEVILNEVDEARETKIQKRGLFSAIHMSSLFSRAIVHTTRCIDRPFNFIGASRVMNPASTCHSFHLLNFLKLTGKTKHHEEFVSRTIASSILFDAYPPRMHSMLSDPIVISGLIDMLEFSPTAIFHEAYKNSCIEALSDLHGDTFYAEQQCHLIEAYLEYLFESVDMGCETSKSIHSGILRGSVATWMEMQSNKTCLVCIRRPPEHVMTCGHAICDICARVFGHRSFGFEHHISLEWCVLCAKYNKTQIRLLPPSAGVRILSIDGGGIYGVVPLEFLQLLQEVIGPSVPIPDLIDEAFGTSSGMMLFQSVSLWPLLISYLLRRFDDTRPFSTGMGRNTLREGVQ